MQLGFFMNKHVRISFMTKGAMPNLRKLNYAQSPDAAHSNWMPWELGVVDGRTKKCFVMPVTKDAKPVTPRREYLSIYPYVKPGIENVMKVFSEGAESRPQVTDFVNFIKSIR